MLVLHGLCAHLKLYKYQIILFFIFKLLSLGMT